MNRKINQEFMHTEPPSAFLNRAIPFHRNEHGPPGRNGRGGNVFHGVDSLCMLTDVSDGFYYCKMAISVAVLSNRIPLDKIDSFSLTVSKGMEPVLMTGFWVKDIKFRYSYPDCEIFKWGAGVAIPFLGSALYRFTFNIHDDDSNVHQVAGECSQYVTTDTSLAVKRTNFLMKLIRTSARTDGMIWPEQQKAYDLDRVHL